MDENNLNIDMRILVRDIAEIKGVRKIEADNQKIMVEFEAKCESKLYKILQ